MWAHKCAHRMQRVTPIRHATELSHVLSRNDELRKPVLFVYSDGGPDHRLTYASVQLSLIAVFKRLDLDFLCAARTAPAHSWRSPLERVMSALKLGLQCVGLMREKGDDEFEAKAKKCTSLATLRDAAKGWPEFRTAALDSIAHVKSLLVMLLERLELKGKKFSSFPSASEQDIDSMWKTVQEIDSTIEKDELLTKKNLPSKQGLTAFLKHCCTSRHYSFQIKKCGSKSCGMCGPVLFQKKFSTNFTSCQIQCLETMVIIRHSRICWVQKRTKPIDSLSRRHPSEQKLAHF